MNSLNYLYIRTCDRVLIGNCLGLRDLGAVRGIKNFTVSSSDNVSKDLEGVTQILLGKIPKTPHHFPNKSVNTLTLRYKKDVYTSEIRINFLNNFLFIFLVIHILFVGWIV